MSIEEILRKYASYLKEDKYDEVFSKLNKEDSTTLLDALTNVVGINVLECMTSIPDDFYSGVKIAGVTIPETITSIGNNAFRDSQVSEVSMADSVKELGNGVFSGCENLQKVRISRSIDKLPKDTFRNCTNLHKVFIPDAIKTISAGAFDGCPDDILIVANFRENENDKIRFPGSEMDFYKKHLKFKKAKP